MPRFVTRWPTDAFDTRIDGVPVITLTGADVPDEHVARVQELARWSGVELDELAPDAPAPAAQLFTQSAMTPPVPVEQQVNPAASTTPSEG